MGRLALIIVFYWVLLFENSSMLGYLFDFGNGLEIRLTLLFKILFLIINILIVIHFERKYSIPKYLLALSIFLLISTLSVWIINPSYFINALAINIHIQLMLNIILFIRYNSYREEQLWIFFKYIRIFAFINAIAVILSYFFPDLFMGFETMTSKSGISRAFGFMGDEVSVFLSFFLFNALVFRKWYAFAIYLVAIFLTAGIGASITVIFLFIYFLVFIIRKTRDNLYILAFVSIMLVPFATILVLNLKEDGIIKRIQNLTEDTQGESMGMRLLSFNTALEMIRERPIWGYGYGNYGQAVVDRYKPKFVEANRENFFKGSARIIMSYTFNPFLQMLAESGIIGLLIFIFFLIKMTGNFFFRIEELNSKLFKFNQASKAWLIVFLLTTLSANWFLPSSFLLLLVVSIVGINDKLKTIYFDKYSEETV